MPNTDLSIIVRGSETFMSRCLTDFGITATEAFLLMYLYNHEEPRQEDVADYFMLDKGTIAKTLKKLEDKEMLERFVNERDQREKFIRLTDKGYCVKDVCVNLIRLWHETMFQGISAEDIAAFISVLNRISANVASNLEKWESVYGKGKE